jgi:hypothetical protein
MKPLELLRGTRTFLEDQGKGFEELAAERPDAKEQLLAAATEFREQADALGPLFAILERSQVVLYHVRASLEAVLDSELEKDPNHTGLRSLKGALDQVLPYERG